jgi:DNA-binding NtrC family response regulator
MKPVDADDITVVPQSPRASSGPLVLQLLGNEESRIIELPEEGSLVIGREEGVELRLEDAAVSRRHALLTVRGGEPFLRDLGSKTGTRIRGVPIEEEARLRPGDLLEVGNTCLWVRQADAVRATGGARALEQALRAACAAGSDDQAFGVILVRASASSEALRALVQPTLRPTDALFELGAGEMGAVCRLGSGSGLEPVAERLRQQLSAQGMQGTLGLSVYPQDGENAVQLLAAARLSLREASASAPPSPAGVAAVVRSAPMRAVYESAASVAASEISVLIVGETGSGKQVLAESIHARSHRARGPFVRINCAALPEHLLEAELFGYEKGAFTGAFKQKVGLLEHAAGGTFMLDEIGDMPVGLQAKLLQVLEEKRTRRVGGLDSRPVDLRVVAATNRDPELLVEEGLFRADLYWRLCGVQIVIPPLRERQDDILPLAESFLETLAQQMGRPRPAITARAAQLLLAAAWPGNVRQLRNVMERALLMSTSGRIEEEPRARWLEGTALGKGTAAGVAPGAPGGKPIKDELVELERERILAALHSTANNQTRAAALLGMPRRTLLEKLDRYGLPRPRKARPSSE